MQTETNITNASPATSGQSNDSLRALVFAGREAAQNTFEVTNEATGEVLRISKAELNRHVTRLSRIEKIWKQVTVSDRTFNQIKSARG